MKKIILYLVLLLLGQSSFGQSKKGCGCHLVNISDSFVSKKQILNNAKLVCDNKDCEVVGYNVSLLLPVEKDYLGPFPSRGTQFSEMALKRIQDARHSFRLVIEEIKVKNKGVLSKADNIIIKVKVE